MDRVILGYSKVEVSRAIADEQPKWQIAERTFDDYWRKIQVQLKADADRKRQPEVSKAIRRNELVFKRAMARKHGKHEDPDLRAALRANLQNARLLGLEAPKLSKLSNDPDNPLPSPTVNAQVSAAVNITFVESDE